MSLGDTLIPVLHRNGGSAVGFEPPTIRDGERLWQLALDSRTLDVNSRYSYLLWCRDYASTSVVARHDGEVVGFITGYRRPGSPGTLFIWQVAVAASHRRQGLARRMLDHLVARLLPGGITALEATVTPDNLASTRLFTSFADARGARLSRDELFSGQLLGEGHLAEMLFRIEPLAPVAA